MQKNTQLKKTVEQKRFSSYFKEGLFQPLFGEFETTRHLVQEIGYGHPKLDVFEESLPKLFLAGALHEKSYLRFENQA